MIQAIFTKKGNKYTSFSIEGHADAGPYGKDLVCAGVSAVVFGILNTLEEDQAKISISKDSNKIVINEISGDSTTQTIIKTLSKSLKTVESTNERYVNIKD